MKHGFMVMLLLSYLSCSSSFSGTMNPQHRGNYVRQCKSEEILRHGDEAGHLIMDKLLSNTFDAIMRQKNLDSSSVSATSSTSCMRELTRKSINAKEGAAKVLGDDLQKSSWGGGSAEGIEQPKANLKQEEQGVKEEMPVKPKAHIRLQDSSVSTDSLPTKALDEGPSSLLQQQEKLRKSEAAVECEGMRRSELEEQVLSLSRLVLDMEAKQGKETGRVRELELALEEESRRHRETCQVLRWEREQKLLQEQERLVNQRVAALREGASEVKAQEQGDALPPFWIRSSLSILQRNVEEMNRLVADAVGGSQHYQEAQEGEGHVEDTMSWTWEGIEDVLLRSSSACSNVVSVLRQRKQVAVPRSVTMMIQEIEERSMSIDERLEKLEHEVEVFVRHEGGPREEGGEKETVTVADWMVMLESEKG
ncbi:hypothetical protein GUITHDRAFT_136350 [Guillardia theta CCMP2712]|uniref:Uncharacterized protein n=1 Tax=Guillardia theta (strain CCMP2712) TaxID=905079 RepID=L1JLX8_GUITC|nr:hypothetical protein GUITHDRAFT_136350 [Guillardia theta CCMP2712]EKX49204.1 hypothetical protein GUITHDRAFT_136350 [Guillardia theta CCMP2712]|eukprot:XP_005836184.1 hypothetical protein GUITHDRAFT_136350 [Guillardia theta CCMP2712]